MPDCRHITLLFLALVMQATDLAYAQAPDGMARVPSGSYLPMYRPAEDSGRVDVPGFFADTYPVTNADFLEFVKANPSWSRSNVSRLFADNSYLALWQGDTTLGPQSPARSPVTHVSWFAARAFAAWRGKRLPTLHEWEYAARAGTNEEDASGDSTFLQRILQWYGKPSPEVLPQVGSVYRNYWGLHDMHGLVWEWVEDFNSVLISGDSRKNADKDRQLFCAGAATGVADPNDYAAFMRYAFRSSIQANYCVANLGFRCVQDRAPSHQVEYNR